MLRNRARRNAPWGGHTRHGFTLVEAMVTMAALGFIMAMAFTLFSRLGLVAVGNDQLARAQSSARVAIDEMTSDLRSAGSEVDLAAGQRAIVYADPFQIAFNANIEPAQDPNGTGLPSALRPDQAGAGVPSDGSPFYLPQRAYATGAETVLFTIDSDLDGRIGATDRSDDPEERSVNPSDYVLYRNVYGWENGQNTVRREPLAVVRGPSPNRTTPVTPLFSYWLDHDDDATTVPVLFGDANGDNRVSGSEALNAGPLAPRDLSRIERVQIQVVSETIVPEKDRKDNDGYREVRLNSEVSIRQQPRSVGNIFGVVYTDLDGSGTWELSEPPLSGVLIQASSGQQTRTGANGFYSLTVSPGTVIVTEVDPTGYRSTTPNSFTIDVYAGGYFRHNFGDEPQSGLGTVKGVVYSDENKDGVRGADERGIAEIKIFSDTGEYTYTDETGVFALTVPVGYRTISEVDSTGYISTTPNEVEVYLDKDGDVVVQNYGDHLLKESGTIEGYVFLDGNLNGVREDNETGVQGAQIVVGPFTTSTDNSGFFTITVPVGTYDVTEVDPPGYTSTSPNTITGVVIETDQVVTLMFGDMIDEDVQFDVIELANTEKALSITSGDLSEDKKGDPDLILGTRFSGGSNNLLVWHNQRVNATTPNSAIFDGNSTYSRPNVADVTSLVARDQTGDRAVEILAGLAVLGNMNLNVWVPELGVLPNLPSYQYMTEPAEIVWDMALADFNNDGNSDLLVGLQDGTDRGHFEIWFGNALGEFSRGVGTAFYMGATATPNALGVVRAVAARDIDGDGSPDIVIGAADAPSKSTVHVFHWGSTILDAGLRPIQSFSVLGTVTDIWLEDMDEEDRNDVDIILATAHTETSGGVELWLQKADGHFGLLGESGRSADDFMKTAGAPLSMIVARLDNDLFADVVVGTRAGYGYDGAVQLAQGFGYLPSEPEAIVRTSVGAVMTMTMNDFNLDGAKDIAVGTQNSSSSGKVFVFFRR